MKECLSLDITMLFLEESKQWVCFSRDSLMSKTLVFDGCHLMPLLVPSRMSWEIRVSIVASSCSSCALLVQQFLCNYSSQVVHFILTVHGESLLWFCRLSWRRQNMDWCIRICLLLRCSLCLSLCPSFLFAILVFFVAEKTCLVFVLLFGRHSCVWNGFLCYCLLLAIKVITRHLILSLLFHHDHCLLAFDTQDALCVSNPFVSYVRMHSFLSSHHDELKKQSNRRKTVMETLAFFRHFLGQKEGKEKEYSFSF